MFLRVLEYYSGILILTTNRVGSFDEAIKSRVHCALYYPLLGKAQTFKIWQMNIKTLEERNATVDPRLRVQFNAREIEDFARSHWKTGNKSNRWNGRQIKNAFQTAVSLADWDSIKRESPNGPLLEAAHFRKVAEASEHFDMYLKKTRRSDQDRARENDQRNDDDHDDHDDDDEKTTDSELERWPVSKRISSSKAKKKAKHEKLSSKKGKKSKPRAAEPSSEEEESGETGSDIGTSSCGSAIESESEAEEPPASPVKAVKKANKKKQSKSRRE